ncbi:hypothetical protein TVAG_478920 [Trichomonas vaginalis G3]|uniref:DUF3447 domain-containing protein n=1 Tax=Trichomonas vaginalis (strain ATCC PRA-98 / G3) TaxID=412133 RepID=A2E008_TRIV3|nr:protein ubiquitination [Trichomonas vaginalis G3]EAY14067.1 hypothetical protein TVAG_478920 [Trichomonas vaginalis G3]KAI5519492.1 protein ubiquitination [Trichomonas vaginalis G3]|eukprot:XP_001326290.1 hypothetical protein [Trichomonas vaginalis G3]
MVDEISFDESLFDKYDEDIRKYSYIENEICSITDSKVEFLANYILQKFSNEMEYIFSLVCYVADIRPFSWKSLVKLIRSLPNYETIKVKTGRFSEFLIKEKIITQRRPRCYQYANIDEVLIEEEFEKDTIPYYIRNDDLDKLIEKLSENNLDFSVNFKLRDKEMTMLDISAFYGSSNTFKYLVMNDIKLTNKTAKYSVMGGNYEIVRISQQKGSDFSQCLMKAIQSHNNDIAYWISENYNYDLLNFFEVYHSFNTFCLNYFLKIKKIDLTMNGSTPLTFVCGIRPDITLFLLENGVDENEVDEYGIFPLNSCCINKNIECAKVILENSRVDINHKDERGSTPLHYAVYSRSLDIVKLLFNKKCLIDIENKERKSQLQIAVDNNDLSIASFLLDKGAFVSKRFIGPNITKEMKQLILNHLDNDDF